MGVTSGNLVFLPGFGASSLVGRNRNQSPLPIWFFDYNLVLYGTKALQLDTDGQSPILTPPGLLAASGSDAFFVYQQLQTQMQSDGWNWTPLAYDWRWDLQTIAGEVATALARRYTSGSFSVLAHSMGGLIAQLAYPLYQAMNPPATWTQTTYLATPHGGCYWGPAGLGVVVVPNWQMYSSILVFARLPGGNLPSIGVGTTALAALQALFASWPSVYEVGPNRGAAWNAIDPNAASIYTLANWTQANPNVQQKWLTQALTVQGVLQALLSQPRPKELCLAGDGTPTFIAVNTPPNFGAFAGYQQGPHGDGTVPLNRALLPNITSIVGPWTHTSIVQDNGVLSNLTAWMLNPPAQSVNVTPPPNVQPLVRSTIPTPTLITPGGVVNAPGPNTMSGLDP